MILTINNPQYRKSKLRPALGMSNSCFRKFRCLMSPMTRISMSFIQDSEVFSSDMHWQPVSVEPGRHCNWWEHEIIRGFLSACASGHRVQVDWKSTGDMSAEIRQTCRVQPTQQWHSRRRRRPTRVRRLAHWAGAGPAGAPGARRRRRLMQPQQRRQQRTFCILCRPRSFLGSTSRRQPAEILQHIRTEQTKEQNEP